MLAVLYFLLYAGCGVVIVALLLPRKSPVVRVWLGLCLGLALMMWLPVLFAFAFTFSLTAHWAALAALAGLAGLAWLGRDRAPRAGMTEKDRRLLWLLALVALPLTVIGGILQYTHNIMPWDNGALYTGQSTYGDLHLHLAIATSLRNATFPPDYSILPGALLTYPFLADSLSTSFMLLGFSLRASIVFPGIWMMALTFSGYVLLAARMAQGKKAAALAALFFFLNGGLGFLYLVDMQGQALGYEGSNQLQSVMGLGERIRNVLEGWYQTPANHAEFNTYNLRWSNVIVDMMVPQRTTLGGWTQVIPCIYLLYDALWPGKSVLLSEGCAPSALRSRLSWRHAVLLGIWAGMLPMINTHCFLALGLMSAGWLIWDLARVRDLRRPWLCALGLAACVGVAWFAEANLAHPSTGLLALQIAAGLCALGGLAAVYLLAARCVSRWDGVRMQLMPRLRFWGIYGLLALAAAMPQLLTWTFRQAVGSGQFLALRFNWVNNTDDTLFNAHLKDGYLWFYIKNIGLPFILLLLSLLENKPKRRFIASGAFVIFLAAEFVKFQPNEYDNNKLFYIWYMLCAVLAADCALGLLRRLKGLRARPVIAVLGVIVCFATGVLAVAREINSASTMHRFVPPYSAEEVEAAQFVEENTAQHATFITANNSGNFVSSLAGRNIVCGPDLWLKFHGFMTAERVRDLYAFFGAPADHPEVLEKYAVDYILVSEEECALAKGDVWGYMDGDRRREALRELNRQMDALYPLIYASDGQTICIYAAEAKTE